MTKLGRNKQYDLEDRTLQFAKHARNFIQQISKTLSSVEDCKQLTKSSGSIGANYIEANEALSKKDFIHRIKICRKESKETIYWLNLIAINKNSKLENERKRLIKEATELMKIFSSIMRKSE
jgi:four helix bundle protein